MIHLLDGLSEDPAGGFLADQQRAGPVRPGPGQETPDGGFNKIDLPEVAGTLAGDQRRAREARLPAHGDLALARTNVKELLWKAAELLSKAPEPEPLAALPVYRPPEDPRAFTIEREAGGGWRVKGAAIERAAAMTYWEYEGSLRRFQRLMETLGVDKALREAGIEEGDTVYIGDYELEWQD